MKISRPEFLALTYAIAGAACGGTQLPSEAPEPIQVSEPSDAPEPEPTGEALAAPVADDVDLPFFNTNINGDWRYDGLHPSCEGMLSRDDLPPRPGRWVEQPAVIVPTFVVSGRLEPEVIWSELLRRKRSVSKVLHRRRDSTEHDSGQQDTSVCNSRGRQRLQGGVERGIGDGYTVGMFG